MSIEALKTHRVSLIGWMSQGGRRSPDMTLSATTCHWESEPTERLWNSAKIPESQVYCSKAGYSHTVATLGLLGIPVSGLLIPARLWQAGIRAFELFVYITLHESAVLAALRRNRVLCKQTTAMSRLHHRGAPKVASA